MTKRISKQLNSFKYKGEPVKITLGTLILVTLCIILLIVATFTQFTLNHLYLPIDWMNYVGQELTDYEIQYSVNDVLGLVEALEKEIYIDGDNLYSTPLTSTGFVRRDIRKAIREGLPKTWVKERKPDYDTYMIMADAFRGGIYGNTIVVLHIPMYK